MIQKINPLMLICESPLHAGAGEGLGYIDLPIQREKHTMFPKVEGSSLKGALRERFRDLAGKSGNLNKSLKSKATKSKEFERAISYSFGPETETGSETFASAMSVAEAKLLLFPIASAKGVYALATCQQVLQTFFQHMHVAGINNFGQLDLKAFEQELANLEEAAKKPEEDAKAKVVSNDGISLLGSTKKGGQAKEKFVILEACAYPAEDSGQLSHFAKWLAESCGYMGNAYLPQKIIDSIVVLPNDDFRDFVEMSTDVITRNKIDTTTGTAENLFNEEYLPQDAVLYSLLQFKNAVPDKAKDANDINAKAADQLSLFVEEVIHNLAGHRFQLGGSQTVGKGMMYANLLNTQLNTNGNK